MFFGTPEWAVPALRALIASDIEIAAVVTNPDRPAGRGYELRPPPVKETALDRGLAVLQPQKASDPGFAAALRDLAPDVCPVVAYGKILPPQILDIPPLGFINLHFSLLPAYRGAAPVQRAIVDGLDVTGVTIMRLTEGMDEGPVLAVAETPIGQDETAGELGARLAEIGAPLLAETLVKLESGDVDPREQDHARATYAPKISTAEAEIDWTRPSASVRNLIRGLNPMPGAWTTFRGTRLKVHEASQVEGSGEPGEVVDAERLIVATGEGLLRLDSVQPAGKRPMSGVEFARGARPSAGERFAGAHERGTDL